MSWFTDNGPGNIQYLGGSPTFNESPYAGTITGPFIQSPSGGAYNTGTTAIQPIAGSQLANVLGGGGQTSPVGQPGYPGNDLAIRPGTGSYTQPGQYQTNTTGGGSRPSPMSIIQQTTQGLPPTAASLPKIVAALQQAGYTDARIATHAGGQPSGDKIEIPSQGIGWDLITASDSPSAAWNVGGGNAGYNIGTGGSLAGGGGQGGTIGSLFGGGFSGAASPMGGAATDAPLLAPWNTPFVAPTGATESNDPGYQFRLNQGMQALERSAAGKGTLLTGGTLKDLTQYAQDYASNEYGNVYNRALQQYGLGYNIFEANQQNQYGRLFDVARLGESAAAGMSDVANAYGGQASNLLTQIGNAGAAGTMGSANAWSNYLGGLGNLATAYGVYRGFNPGPTGTGNTGTLYGGSGNLGYG